MVRCEHFIYGHFDGLGIRLVKSEFVDELVSRKSLGYLKHLSKSTQTLLPENIVAITFYSERRDEYDRETAWNHTILIPIKDYFKLNPPTIFERHFIKSLSEPPTNPLEPLRIKGVR